MNKRKPRPCRRNTSPLHTPLADRLNPGALSMLIPTNVPPQSPRMPSPPRSARDIITLLSAITGLSLAARPDAEVELLPGSPTTVLVVSGGKARATFVLPVSRDHKVKIGTWLTRSPETVEQDVVTLDGHKPPDRSRHDRVRGNAMRLTKRRPAGRVDVAKGRQGDPAWNRRILPATTDSPFEGFTRLGIRKRDQRRRTTRQPALHHDEEMRRQVAEIPVKNMPVRRMHRRNTADHGGQPPHRASLGTVRMDEVVTLLPNDMDQFA